MFDILLDSLAAIIGFWLVIFITGIGVIFPIWAIIHYLL